MCLILPLLAACIFSVSAHQIDSSSLQASEDVFRIISNGKLIDSDILTPQDVYSIEGIELIFSEHPVILYDFISFDVTVVNKDQAYKVMSFTSPDGTITDEQRIKLQEFGLPTQIYIDRITLHGEDNLQQKMASIFFHVM